MSIWRKMKICNHETADYFRGIHHVPTMFFARNHAPSNIALLPSYTQKIGICLFLFTQQQQLL